MPFFLPSNVSKLYLFFITLSYANWNNICWIFMLNLNKSLLIFGKVIEICFYFFIRNISSNILQSTLNQVWFTNSGTNICISFDQWNKNNIFLFQTQEDIDRHSSEFVKKSIICKSPCIKLMLFLLFFL